MDKINILFDPTSYSDNIGQKLESWSCSSLGMTCHVSMESTEIEFDIPYTFEYEVDIEKLTILENEEVKVDICFAGLDGGIVIDKNEIIFEFENHTIVIKAITAPKWE